MEAEFEGQSFIKRELARALDAGARRALSADRQGRQRRHRRRGGLRAGAIRSAATFRRLSSARGGSGRTDGPLGEFVLRRALTDAGRWPHLYVAVNLSPVQVRNPRLVDLLSAVLDDTKIAPSRVVLEMTEKILVEDPLTAKVRLEQLHAIGVKLGLDDFGAGYSSLAYLKSFPIDALKIDRGFVAALDQSANAGVVIQAIAGLGAR
jgi:EAL domain-containing protein (putative c-di-GMP-specific phosphodiesterase class I)